MAAARKTAIVYVSLALGFAWLYWATVKLSRSGVLPFSMESDGGFFRSSVPGTIAWAILSNFGPAIAGVIAVGLFRGTTGIARLGRSIVQWRIPAWLYAAGLFGFVINLAVVIAGLFAKQLRFAPQFPLPKLVLVFFAMVLFDGPLGEEIGWRGVLLPELLERFKALPAAILVGVVWYLWHIPLYLAAERGMDLTAHVEFLYTCLALSIIFTWFFLKSAGSTFLAIYLHAFSNYFTFLRIKTFARAGASNLTPLVYLIVLTVITIAAAMALRRAPTGSAEWRR